MSISFTQCWNANTSVFIRILTSKQGGGGGGYANLQELNIAVAVMYE